MVNISDLHFTIRLKKTYTGNLLEGYVGQYPLLSLENAISIAYTEKYLMFICRRNASAIYVYNNQFFIFDSHSRNSDGYCVEEGKSVIVCKNDLRLLSKYLRKLVLSNGSKDLNIQYDLHIFKLSSLTKQSVARQKKKQKFICVVPEEPLQKQSMLPQCKSQRNATSSKGPNLCSSITLTDLPFLEPENKHCGKKRMHSSVNYQHLFAEPRVKKRKPSSLQCNEIDTQTLFPRGKPKKNADSFKCSKSPCSNRLTSKKHKHVSVNDQHLSLEPPRKNRKTSSIQFNENDRQTMLPQCKSQKNTSSSKGPNLFCSITMTDRPFLEHENMHASKKQIHACVNDQHSPVEHPMKKKNILITSKRN